MQQRGTELLAIFWACRWIKIIIKTKNLSVEKERSIDSKAQKKTNKITKFRINAFFISVKATFYKNELIINLVILFVFFCAFESMDLSFSTDRFFVLICMLF